MGIGLCLSMMRRRLRRCGLRWGRRRGRSGRLKADLDEGLGIKEGKRKWDAVEVRRLIFEVERVA